MDEIEHNRIAREFAQITTNWGSTGNRPAGDIHTCNCIGCCPKCGMCSTHPRHTANVCNRLVEHDAIRSTIIYDD